MKKVGIVGGISWASTLDYYRLINQGVNEKLGGLQAAEIVLYSLNFAEVQERTWDRAYDLLLNACRKLEQCGVDAIVLAANTAHIYAERVQGEIQKPIISIITATAGKIHEHGLKTVGLLGTPYTMQRSFYKDKLASLGVTVLVPESQETIDYIEEVIKNELGRGIVKKESKEQFIRIANDLRKRGAEGLILGCTEIPMLIHEEDFSYPVFDTTKIHADAIVSYIIS